MEMEETEHYPPQPPEIPEFAASAAGYARAERKVAQVLDGARAIILARGFEGATVDDIAREAGVSKATMYRYYPDKAAIFAAVMQRDCCQQENALLGVETEGRSLHDILVDIGERFIGFVLSPDTLRMFRTAVAETERFPEVGQAFFASGPDRGRVWLGPILAGASARGEIEIDCPNLAAERFFALLKADLFLRKLFGVPHLDTETDLSAHVARTVHAFLRMVAPS